MLLAELATGRDNNFNLIRFIAASLVLYSHSYPLAMGYGYPEPLGASLGTSWGSIAVDVFFVASGFFIAASFDLKKSFKSFVAARVLRIYPALIVTTLLTVFVLGPIFTNMSLLGYFSDYHWFQYLIKNSLIITGIEYNLPGVFVNNPYPQAVNGSLWTLPYEIKMYFLLVLFFSLFSFIKRKSNTSWNVSKTFFITLTSFALALHLNNHFLGFYTGQSLKLFTMFFMGSCFYFLQDKIVINSKIGLTLIAVLLVASINKDIFFATYTLFLAYIVFYLAYIPKGLIRKFNVFGDYSYGIYIYAFPIQQVIASLWPNCSIFEMMGLSFIFTVIAAYISWHLVEERSLNLKRHF